METKKLKLTFYGGTGTVTGANFLLENKDKKILVDCGLFQGEKIGDDSNREPFPYKPSDIDILIITHAHIDHIGRVPKLVKDGFRGKIYSTKPTMELTEIMLIDSVRVLTREAQRDNLEPIYREEDVKQAMTLWEGFPYHQEVDLGDGFKMNFRDSGHILGSAMVDIIYNGKKIVFTGDLGNSPAPLLKDTEDIDDADYIVMESVYGDRNHESKEDRKTQLEDIIEETMSNNGVLMIPAFSLERTQDLLFEINDLVEKRRIPRVPIYLDSPLAIKVTAIYKQNEDYFNREAQNIIKSGDDIFKFPGLKFTSDAEASKAINGVPNPKIIIAGSGMSNGGRIIHHEKRYLPDPKSTLLLVGYQAIGTLGRILEEGAKEVTILGDVVPVKARIAKIQSYSSHKDSDNLVDFVANDAKRVKRVFLVMGEPKSSLYLSQKLRDYLGISAVVPLANESMELEF